MSTVKTADTASSVAARLGVGNRASSPAPAMQPASPIAGGNRLTKTGKPDRRFLGQRDLLPETLENDYTHPTTGFIDADGRHRTQDGAPDVRFKENRALTADQVKRMQAQFILDQTK